MAPAAIETTKSVKMEPAEITSSLAYIQSYLTRQLVGFVFHECMFLAGNSCCLCFFLLENVSVLWRYAKARISIARLRSFVGFCGEILTPEMPREVFGGW